MDLAVCLLMNFLGGAAALLLPLWFSGRTIDPKIESPLDPILGRRDQAAIHDTVGPFIPMPNDLQTKDEIVAWLTQELPKRTSELSRSR